MKKDKTCFIIMPISDNPNYQSGHFDRVYEFIIKPACEIAGFTPIRADEVVTTNYIALDIIKKIIESNMAICDLSSQNPNVMYELGIRQAFNKPVAFIKDNITKRVFDIQGFRDLEYDMTLRIDNVNICKAQLAETLTQTYENKDSEINSLVKLLSISPAEIPENTRLSLESELILNQLSILTNRIDKIDKTNLYNNQLKAFVERLPPSLNNIQELNRKLSYEEMINLSPNEKVIHEKFGEGEVLKVTFDDNDLKTNPKIDIRFNQNGTRKFLVKFINLYHPIDYI